MTVEHVEILVEEPSMEAALRVLLPRILGPVSFEVYPYQCKQQLLSRLPARLAGYAKWLPETYRIVVIVDRDHDRCDVLKRQLERAAREAGLRTRTTARGATYAVVNRLAIEELEAWFVGDWDAVRAAYPRVPKALPRRARDPDDIAGGTWEYVERLLKRAGYFPTGLRKIEAARHIACGMDPERNRSRSFQALRDALAEMAAQQEEQPEPA